MLHSVKSFLSVIGIFGMNITVDQQPKSTAKVRVEASPEEFKPDLDAAVQRISSSMKFDGFRPGKAPYDVVIKRVGEQEVWQEAVETLVRRTFVQAVKEHQLKTVGQPQIGIEKLAPGNPVIYTAVVALLPDVTLPDFLKLSAKRNNVPVTDADVTKSVEDLRKIIATEKPVERPAKMGDRVEIDVDVYVDKIPVEGGKSRKHPATLGEGNFIPGFENNVVGMTTGQTKEFVLKFPKEYHAKNLAGKDAEFKVTVQKVAELELPNIDDMFAKTVANLGTIDELKGRLKEDLETDRRKREEQVFEVALLEELVKHTKFTDIPDVLIENELDRMVGELKHDVSHRGMKFEDYLSSMKKDEATLRKELTNGANQRVKTALAIRKIAETEKIGVNDEEIKAEIEVARQQTPPEQHGQFETEDFREYVHSVLTNRKAIDLVKTKQSAA